MHTILPSPDDLVAITMSGKITGADLDAAMERLERAFAAADARSMCSSRLRGWTRSS
jgi:hypothetical protein